jgi:hypothetical protein
VERNWFVESLASRVKVQERLFARLWILETSMARGPKNSSRDSFVVAIEKRSRSLHYMGGKIRYRDLAAFRSLSLMEKVACNNATSRLVRLFCVTFVGAEVVQDSQQ